jgi:acyl-CoA thioesterase I
VARFGIERIRATGADVMLMDLQYAPAVLQHAGYREMQHVLSAVASSEDVPMVRRFAMMRHWAEDGTMTLPVMLAGDRLHMSDASYDCLARHVAQSIAAADEEPSLALVAPAAIPGR